MIEMVKEQVRMRREEIEGVKGMKEKVEGVLKGLGRIDREGMQEANGYGAGMGEKEVLRDETVRVEKELDRAVWAALDEVEVDA